MSGVPLGILTAALMSIAAKNSRTESDQAVSDVEETLVREPFFSEFDRGLFLSKRKRKVAEPL